jgi:CheY-like chemotaxis protein
MMLLASESTYYFGPEVVRTLSGAGRVLGGAVSGQRLNRDILKLERELADKRGALAQWEAVMGGGVPATAQTLLHGVLDSAHGKAAFLVPAGARFVAAATESALHGLPMDGVWSEAVASAEQNRRALWVNPGKTSSDPRASFGRWILAPSPAGALFFAPEEGRTAYAAPELARFARMGEIAILLIPREDQAEPDRLLELAGRLVSGGGSPEILAEVAAELVPGGDAVIVWRRSEGRLSVCAVQGCAAEPLEKLHLPVGQGTVGKAALAVQPLVIESGAEMGRSWAEYSARERGAFAEAFGGFERPAAEFAAPIPHADLVLQFVRFTRGGWPEDTRRLVDALVHIYKPGDVKAEPERIPVNVPAGWSEAANDLNNIFTGILGQAELLNRRLAEGGLPALERRGLEQIIQAAQEGGDLVGGLGPAEGEEEPGGLDWLAADLLSGRHITDDLYLLPDNRAVQIHTEFEKTPKLAADRQKLQSVLWNALTTVARDQATVSLGTASDERYLYLAVGGPNTREPLSGPFGDFFRAPDLGWRNLLPPAELDFLRSVGAQIAADDERVPQRLVVRFPYGPTAASSMPSHPGLNVLAIDDQEIIRDLLLNMFMGMGHRITVCKSGEEGLAALGQAKFDLVLTDLGMPGMSGWEVAHAVKEQSPDTPVVLITGWGFNFAEEQVRKAGVDYVLTKPFRLEHLTEVVETAVRRSPQVH